MLPINIPKKNYRIYVCPAKLTIYYNILIQKNIYYHIFFLNKTIFDHVTFTNRGTNANFFLDVIL